MAGQQNYSGVGKAGLVIVLLAGAVISLTTAMNLENEAYAQTFVTKWGARGTESGQFGRPAGIAIDSGGNVYVADTQNHRIQKFDSNGKFLAAWDKEGHDLGEFRNVVAIAIDKSNNVYVLDENGYRIQKLTTDGQAVTQWRHRGIEYVESELYNAVSLATDSKNNVYVVDGVNVAETAGQYQISLGLNVKKFTSDGNFVARWDARGDAEGDSYEAFSLTIDPSDNVYVIGISKPSGGNSGGLVKKFTSDGKFLSSWGSLGLSDEQFVSAFTIAADPAGNLYISDQSTGTIKKFTGDGKLLLKWGSKGTEDGQFREPLAMTTDRSGNTLYVADARNDTIQKFAVGDAQVAPTSPSDGTVSGLKAHSEKVRLTINDNDVEIKFETSSDITEFSFDEAGKKIMFKVSGPDGTLGTTVLHISSLLKGPYIVTFDGNPVTDFETAVDDATGEATITLSYHHSIREITVSGTEVVPEFPSAVVGIIGVVIGAIAILGRTRLSAFWPLRS